MTACRRLGALLLAAGFALGAGACGSDERDDPPAATTLPTTASPATTTPAATTPTTTGGGRAAGCAALAAEALDLYESWRNDMRGIAGPSQEAQHRAEARALADEARRLGCPVPEGIEGVIDG